MTSPPIPPRRDVGVVIVAGGAGTRTGGTELKQFRWVAGKPMLLHSLQAFMEHPEVVSVVCVLPQQYAGDPPPWIFQSDVDRLMVSLGGRTRMESVWNGIEDLSQDAEIILVHDAARPLVSRRTIDEVIATARTGSAAVAALPVVDTLKQVDDTGRIVRTVDRAGLWRAQTPQGFPRDLLLEAHRAGRAAGVDATDDAALCERLGMPVRIVRGSEAALKVTEDADFARAEAMAGVRE